jgi:hypothetical protein
MNKTQPFKVHHVARLLRGATRAGVADPTVHIKTSDGTEYTVAGGGSAKPTAVVRKPATAARKSAVAPTAAVVARRPVAAVVRKPR